MKISIQGNLGSFSHIAASAYFSKDIEILERPTFVQAFEDLKEHRSDYIVIPFENSTHGSVYQNYDNITKYGFHIIGELYLKINFHLIVNPGTKFQDISEMHTHPVALNQIKKFLKENPQIKTFEHEDTAGSVKMIKEKNLLKAASAASKFAAELYGMEVLKENIHENSKNFTRFFVLSKDDNKTESTKEGKDNNEDKFKTTLQFTLGEEAGSLYKALGAFATRNIALTKIESRPILETDWEYRFYVDVMSNTTDSEMQNALKELGYYVKELKILGSYKTEEYINT